MRPSKKKTDNASSSGADGSRLGARPKLLGIGRRLSSRDKLKSEGKNDELAGSGKSKKAAAALSGRAVQPAGRRASLTAHPPTPPRQKPTGRRPSPDESLRTNRTSATSAASTRQTRRQSPASRDGGGGSSIGMGQRNRQPVQPRLKNGSMNVNMNMNMSRGQQPARRYSPSSSAATADDSIVRRWEPKAPPPVNDPPKYMDLEVTNHSLVSSLGGKDDRGIAPPGAIVSNAKDRAEDVNKSVPMKEFGARPKGRCPFHIPDQTAPPPVPPLQRIALEQLETGEIITVNTSEEVDADQPRDTVGCTPHECHGAMVNKGGGFTAVGDAYSQSLESKVEEATAFLRQFATETDHLATPEDLQDRIDDVTSDIRAYGSYRHTYEELQFGCRLAWRNSGRCIMRKVSFNLELRDCRSVKTSHECFHQILEHLRYAGNGGSVKSVISVFPQKGDGISAPVRVWNRQLVGYAAYQRQDGSVMGDPVNLSFTAMCVKLGWNPPTVKSDFDFLPLVISDDIVGHDRPRVFNIPADAIMEVPIHHPEHELFSSLNLRWYAMPAISNMGVDIGGVYYQTCPFNGWYQVTEIGRDLLDKQRYDLAEAVAVACGIQRSKIGVWRDRVQVEVHNAILHSFAKASVSLVDHHTASESFIDFHKEEISKRGRCPADWVWLTPPAGGSMTKVFHQEMVSGLAGWALFLWMRFICIFVLLTHSVSDICAIYSLSSPFYICLGQLRRQANLSGECR